MESIPRLDSTAAEFESQLQTLLAQRGAGDAEALAVAAKVIAAVERDGDQALLA
ncbi:MAG: hypothetical protein VW985_07655 [Gammaproteobacteria bacterium]